MIRAAVLGSPISHSLSPVLHRKAYEFLDVVGTYEAKEVTASELRDFLAGLDNSWTGFSLTMPLKEEVLRIADRVDALAKQIDSANTLVRTDDGWHASSTDVNGFVEALKDHGIVEPRQIVILGSGATARAAAAACDGAGREITVIHRSARREDAMNQAAPLSTMYFRSWGEAIGDADLLINTTPAGAADIYCDGLEVKGVLFESLYNPWPTKLLGKWLSSHGNAIDGLDLLVHQGIDQVALFTNKEIDRSALAPILRAACLSGMQVATGSERSLPQ